MKKLNIDTGVEEFRVNGRGVLRFNPADPNLYHRFFAATVLHLCLHPTFQKITEVGPVYLRQKR